MQNSNLGETQPTRAKTNRKRNLLWLSGLFFAFLIIGFVFAAGAVGGYYAGNSELQSIESTAAIASIQEQYVLGVSDLQAGRYDLARQRFEYVLEHDPGFPGVMDKLAEVKSILYATSTPTPVPPTSTPTPTRDLRPVEEIYARAESYFAQGDWDAVINTLISLREVDIGYRVIEVDSLLYRSLRSRGVQKIQEQGKLEGGIYDLALAERFGPLDVEAITWRNLARMYMIGLSFWDVIPEQAVYYFGQVVSGSGYLRDGSGWTARERYRAVLLQYGDQFARAEQWCSAESQYELALSIRSDTQIQATETFLSQKCSPPTSTPVPTSPTPTATVLVTATPTEIPIVPTTALATLTQTVPAVSTTQPAPPTATYTAEATATSTVTTPPVEPSPTETNTPEPTPVPTDTSVPTATLTDTPAGE